MQKLFRIGSGFCTYNYSIAIDEKGQIIISNSKMSGDCSADKEEGKYQFIDGAFRLIE